jgi:hypothetical protein
MYREIDILLKAAAKDYAVIEKESHEHWTIDDLREAARAGSFLDNDFLGPPTDQTAISGVFPGCCQQQGAPSRFGQCALVGETSHFLIFSTRHP